MDDNFFLWPLLAGFILDCIIGDPHWLPHPVRLFGWCIARLEERLNKGAHRKLKGAVSSLLLVAGTWGVVSLIFWALSSVLLLKMLVATIGVFWGLAGKSLIVESRKVLTVLKHDGIEAARVQLSYIVGRDTSKLNEHQIRTAVLETMAENLSDGLIAPLLFYALGGVPMLMAFKMASTLDSMIAYKDARYKDYGWLAARLDDLLNLIPARLTAILMSVSTLSVRGLYFTAKFGHRHSSPNAGYPEAALSGILNCRFGGPNVYHGELVQKPYIGENNRLITQADFNKTVYVNSMTSVLMLVLAILIGLYIH